MVLNRKTRFSYNMGKKLNSQRCLCIALHIGASSDILASKQLQKFSKQNGNVEYGTKLIITISTWPKKSNKDGPSAAL